MRSGRGRRAGPCRPTACRLERPLREAPTETGRRFDDRETNLILRLATEIEARALPDGAMDRSRGRTLAEIETIAEGAGIDVGAVRAALAAFETEELGSLARVVGGPTVFQLERTVPGTIRVEEMADLVSSACWALGIDTGEVTTHANGVRFYRKTEEGPSTEIELTRRQDQTRIRVRGRYDDPAGWTLIGGGITTGVTAGLAIATLDPSLLGIAGIIGGAAGAGWLGARAFWRRTSRRVRRRLAGLMDRLETQARSAAGARSEGSAASGQLRSGAESQEHRAGPAGSVVEPADDGD